MEFSKNISYGLIAGVTLFTACSTATPTIDTEKSVVVLDKEIDEGIPLHWSDSIKQWVVIDDTYVLKVEQCLMDMKSSENEMTGCLVGSVEVDETIFNGTEIGDTFIIETK